jgi:hypothetical protein
MTKYTRMVYWALTLMLLGTSAAFAMERHKPFVLGSESQSDFAAMVKSTASRLKDAGFEVVGEYTPFPDSHILVFTNDRLKQVAAQSQYGGFAMAQRASIVNKDGKVEVAYTNPVYMAHAYRLAADLKDVSDQLAEALGRVTEFGAKRGLVAGDLREYHYTFGMEYFDEPYELASYRSHGAALAAVSKQLQSNKQGVRSLYRIDLPGKQETIIGVSMQAPDPDSNQKFMDDKFQMSVVDHGQYSQVAYLPYEIMVTGNKVVALHMRFRMAVNFPSLRMVGKNSFMTISSSPEHIQRALTLAVGGEYSEASDW